MKLPSRPALLPALVLGAAAALASCASGPVAIPEGMSARELVQKAQEASDETDYDRALAYYEALVERFGGDPAFLVAGEYEIAFIYYKQGKLPASQALFESLLARYETEAAAYLPPRYKILAELILPKVKEARGQKP